jgi:hypothetical protein
LSINTVLHDRPDDELKLLIEEEFEDMVGNPNMLEAAD